MNKTYSHIPPQGGWEPQSYYVIEASVRHGNPIFKAILYTGFLSDNEPGGYSRIFTSGSMSELSKIQDFMYIKAIRKINMEIPNERKQVKDLNLFDQAQIQEHERSRYGKKKY